MDLKRIKRFFNTKKKFFEKIYISYKDDEDLMSIKSFEEYVKTGKNTFCHKVVLFGEEKIKDYDILTIYKFVEGYYLSKNILKFEVDNNYYDLLEGYYYSILYNILSFKKGILASGVLSTDLSLMLMFSITYFPKDAEMIGKQLIKFLEKHKQKEVEKNYYKGRIKKMFGYSDIVWLSSIIANHHNKKEHAKEIENYCNDDINPIYKKAVDNLFSKDESIVNEWVNEMVEFHIQNSKSDLTLPFNHEEWQLYPIEIISLLEIRFRENMSIDFIDNPYIKEFIPHLGIELPVKLDDFTLKLRDRIINE